MGQSIYRNDYPPTKGRVAKGWNRYKDFFRKNESDFPEPSSSPDKSNPRGKMNIFMRLGSAQTKQS